MFYNNRWKMILKMVTTVLLLWPTLQGYAQLLISGNLSSEVDGKPIAYANIGIENSPVGTLSNANGTFQIAIPAGYLQDTLLFSALGHEKRLVPVQSITKTVNVKIVLKEKVTTLKTVTVVSKRKKEKIFQLGNRFTRGGFMYADSVSAGAAMALLVDNKYPSHHEDLNYPFFLERVNFFVHKNTAPTFKVRVRFLDVDATSGLPAFDLFSHDIIATSSIKKGWLEVDLRSYALSVNKPFFLVLEWIMDDQDRLSLLDQYDTFRRENPDRFYADSTTVDGQKVGFWNYIDFAPGTHLGVSALPFSLQHYTCYYRTNSFGGWKRAPIILTARVSVSAAGE